MKRIFLFAQLLLSFSLYAQQFAPEWYILEKGCTISVIKPGVNDLTYFLATSNNKPIDAAAVNTMIEHISYHAGDVILVHSKLNDKFIATDIEGRNIVVEGSITKVQRGKGCTVGYMKEGVKTGKAELLKGTFVWIKEQKEDGAYVTIQCADNQSVDVPVAKLYDINATTLEMANTSKHKKVE